MSDAEAMHGAALDLAFRPERVEHAAEIVHCDVFEHPRDAGFRVDPHVSDMTRERGRGEDGVRTAAGTARSIVLGQGRASPILGRGAADRRALCGQRRDRHRARGPLPAHGPI